MGVDVRLVLYAPSEAQAEEAAAAAFRRIAALDQAMSDYRPTSELNRLCAQAGGPPVPISRDLFVVLERAVRLARESGGAFDPTVAPAVALWRRARRTGDLPAASELRAARELVDWRSLELNRLERTARLRKPGMRLDLGGIAKGYAGDQAQAVLKRRRITRALVEAGGDIVVSGPPPDKEGWEVEVRNAAPSGPAPVLAFAHCAISTSGDTEQFVVVGGRRYSHIVDPRTGLGLTSRVAVTVAAPNGLTSDGLSTAVSVLGAERGRALARRYAGTRLWVRTADDL